MASEEDLIQRLPTELSSEFDPSVNAGSYNVLDVDRSGQVKWIADCYKNRLICLLP